jgi:signal transduction histidine kinase
MIQIWSLRRKLALVTMATSISALALSTLGFLVYDLAEYRKSMRRDLLTEAQIVGASSTAALVFSDGKAALENLEELSHRRTVLAASIYDADGNLLASYPPSEWAALHLNQVRNTESADGIIRVDWPTYLDRQKIGTVVLHSDDRDFRKRAANYLMIVAGLMVVSLSVAFLLSTGLRKLITNPIIDLKHAMHAVSASGDYTLRVPKESPDEIGDLIDGFNAMISEIHHAESELLNLNDNLEERVAERSQAAEERTEALVESEKRLRLAKDMAERANQTKSAFLANVSHELRTPLNAIIGYSEILDEELREEGQTAHVADIARIRSAGRHLLTIINDILDLSKIEAGHTQVFTESFDLCLVIEEVIATVEPLAAKRTNRLTVTMPESLMMCTDQMKIRQVLINLLSNACKFTDHGLIHLRAHLDSSSSWAIVEVQDNGIGISRDQLERIFEPFVQAETATTRKYGGTGLGLPISRKFCRLLGGDLVVRSAPRSGSSFTVRIPTEYLSVKGSENAETTTPTEMAQASF